MECNARREYYMYYTYIMIACMGTVSLLCIVFSDSSRIWKGDNLSFGPGITRSKRARYHLISQCLFFV